MVVELCGIPGSGKSTIAEHLTRALAPAPVRRPRARIDTDVRAPIRQIRKAALALGELARRPRACVAVGRAIVRSQPSASDGLGRLLQWTITQRMLRDEGLVLLDEGLAQALWSVGLRGDLGGVSDVLAGASIAAPDLIVALDVAPDVAANRLRARASMHSRVQRAPEAALADELARGVELLERVLALVATVTPRVRVHRLDAGAPAAELAGTIGSIVRDAIASG